MVADLGISTHGVRTAGSSPTAWKFASPISPHLRARRTACRIATSLFPSQIGQDVRIGGSGVPIEGGRRGGMNNVRDVPVHCRDWVPPCGTTGSCPATIPFTLFERGAPVVRAERSIWPDALYFQPGVRPACSIHICSSGRCASSRVVTLMYRVRSVFPSGGGDSKSAPPRKTTFTETS